MRLVRFLGVIILLILFVNQIYSNDVHSHNANSNDTSHHKKQPFNVGEFILDHIGDSYEWHITTINDKHISLPLPVILYVQGRGLEMFSSAHFHHGHQSYTGKYNTYQIAHEGDKKGKIIPIDKHGKLLESVTIYDISITKNVLSLLISVILIIVIFTQVAKSYKKRKNMAPKGLQSLLEPLIIFIVDDVAKASIGEKKYLKFTPYLLTLFFFIFLNNLLGLVPFFPGGANLTGNIAVTMFLAILTFIITTINGNKHYWAHIINTPGVPWWLKIPIPLMPFVEILGVFTKPIVLMIRLFANITAGHIIALGFFSLIFIFGQIIPAAGYGASVISIAFTVFMSLLELLVAFIQAYVFTLLSALYFGMATEEVH